VNRPNGIDEETAGLAPQTLRLDAQPGNGADGIGRNG